MYSGITITGEEMEKASFPVFKGTLEGLKIKLKRGTKVVPDSALGKEKPLCRKLNTNWVVNK